MNESDYFAVVEGCEEEFNDSIDTEIELQVSLWKEAWREGYKNQMMKEVKFTSGDPCHNHVVRMVRACHEVSLRKWFIKRLRAMKYEM